MRSLALTDRFAPLRSFIADVIGEDDDDVPELPADLPAGVRSTIAREVEMLTEYQSDRYANLYLHRIRRFADRRGIDAARLEAIATRLGQRMRFSDLPRLAQVKLGLVHGTGIDAETSDLKVQIPLEELAAFCPARMAAAISRRVQSPQWAKRRITLRLSPASFLGRRKLGLLVTFRRLRLRSARYTHEKDSVERWLHMIDRSLTRCPAATSEIITSVDFVRGYGGLYRQRLANWQLIMDRLAKPVFDGRICMSGLAAALAQAKAAAATDPPPGAVEVLIEDLIAADRPLSAAAPGAPGP